MKIEGCVPDTKDDIHAPGVETPQATLPTDLLAHAAEDATRRVQALKAQLAALQASLAAAEEEERLLSRLLAVRRGERDARDLGAQAPPQHDGGAPGANPTSGDTLLAEVVAILEKAARPLHISELMRLLTERKVPIPGSGNQANVISYLRRDQRIVRPSRGIYGLREWGLADMPSRPKKRTRKRRSKKRTPRTNAGAGHTGPTQSR